MKIKVLKINFNDQVSYLANTGYNEDFGNSSPKTVDSPLGAINYALPENEERYQSDLHCFYITNVGGARSGIRADSVDLVEFEVKIEQVACETVRQGKKQP